MSADSFAVFRKHAGEDIGKLAEEHFKHDLQDSDRDALKSAANKISTHATVGSLLGLGLGLFLAFRIRSSRSQMFNAFRTAEKPTHVKFADGREGTCDGVLSLSALNVVAYICYRLTEYCCAAYNLGVQLENAFAPIYCSRAKLLRHL